MDITQLAYHVKEVRDLQKAYFDSRNGRYADRKLLDAAKLSEKNLDALVDFILTSPDPSNPGIWKNGVHKSLQPAKVLKAEDEFRFLGKRKVHQVKEVTHCPGEFGDEVWIVVYPKSKRIVLDAAFEIVIIRTFNSQSDEAEH